MTADTYLSVICPPADARTFSDFAARAADAGLTEYRTEPMVYHEWSKPAPIIVPPPAPPWWHSLKAGTAVKAARDGVPIMGGDGKPYIYLGKPIVSKLGASMTVSKDVTPDDISSGRVQVWAVDRKPFLGGLYVSANDIAPA